MNAVVEAPIDLIETIANLRLPALADARLQDLMDRNNNGRLAPSERKDLEELVEWSEEISLLRARALHLLGRSPL